MKYLLLISIKIYWSLIPKTIRGECLFKKSCSHYVFDTTNSKGLIAGLSAIRFRFDHCRSSYSLMNSPDGLLLISAKNKVFKTHEIDKRILDKHCIHN